MCGWRLVGGEAGVLPTDQIGDSSDRGSGGNGESQVVTLEPVVNRYAWRDCVQVHRVADGEVDAVDECAKLWSVQYSAAVAELADALG